MAVFVVEPADLLRPHCRERGLVFSSDRVGFARELERTAGDASVRVQGTKYTVQGRRVTILNLGSTGGLRMKPGVLLTATTLITALFLTLHVADDIARGIDTIGLHTLTAILVLGLWLYGTLVLSGRRSGYLLQLLLSILGLGVVIIHLKGAHMGQIAVSSGGVVFVWTLFVLGTTSFLSMLLCLHGLLTLRKGQPR